MDTCTAYLFLYKQLPYVGGVWLLSGVLKIIGGGSVRFRVEEGVLMTRSFPLRSTRLLSFHLGPVLSNYNRVIELQPPLIGKEGG